MQYSSFPESPHFRTQAPAFPPPRRSEPEPEFAIRMVQSAAKPPKPRIGIVGLAVATLLGGVIGGGSVMAGSQYFGLNQPRVVMSAPDEASGTSTNPRQAISHSADGSPNWQAVANQTMASVVAIEVRTGNGGGQGSGVVISKKGDIVTNNHVISGSQQIIAKLNGKVYEAKLIGVDPSTDLAVVRLVDPPKDLVALPWGNSEQLKVGDPVMAVGNPLGLSNTATTGIISALDRPVRTNAVRQGQETSQDPVITAAIQTNAAINPGTSGGALVDAKGNLIGITSSIASLADTRSEQQAGNIGIGFAIPSFQAEHVVQQLIAKGEATYPKVGVMVRDSNTIGPLGAQVTTVQSGSSGERGGLKAGDLITVFAGHPVQSANQLVGLTRSQSVGSTISVTVIRDGKTQNLQLHLDQANR